MQECNLQTALSENSDVNFELIKKAEKTADTLIKKMKELSFTLALAESCTCGLVSSLLARIPGASAVLWGSFVCYTQEAKISMLDIDKNELLAHGLVSKETASFMAAGALQKSGADISASVTGLAGPQGDGSKTAVGTVWAAVAVRNGNTVVKEFHFDGSRNEVRLKAAIAVFELIQDLMYIHCFRLTD